MKINLNLLLSLFSFASITVFGQVSQEAETTSANRITNQDYNLPPGTVIMPKSDLTIDYSYLLSEIEEASATSNYVRAQFIKEFTEQDWVNMEANNPDEYAYYTAAKTFYDNLSPKVKVILSTEELWYIYMFDQRLKSQLTNY